MRVQNAVGGFVVDRERLVAHGSVVTMRTTCPGSMPAMAAFLVMCSSEHGGVSVDLLSGAQNRVNVNY
jgi:hypothetical protein